MFFKLVVIMAVVACTLQGVVGRTVVMAAPDGYAEKEVVPKVEVGGGGVSASFGGYSASAGLGGLVGGSPGAAGGLYARAGTPDGTGASAGLAGSLNEGDKPVGGAHAGANVGSGSFSSTNTAVVHKTRNGNPNLYNDIFNIPTSILGAVNRLLNGATGAVGNIHLGTSGAGAHVTAGKTVDVGSRIDTGADAHAGGQVTSTGGTRQPQAGGLFSDIFNIPITALNAVNQLLNNNKNGK